MVVLVQGGVEDISVLNSGVPLLHDDRNCFPLKILRVNSHTGHYQYPIVIEFHKIINKSSFHFIIVDPTTVKKVMK